MNKVLLQYNDPSDQYLVSLYKNAWIVFDSSALLDMYNYPNYTRLPLFTEIMDKFPGRLWIPAQVEFEFLKNKEKVKSKPVVEYEQLVKRVGTSKEGGYIDGIRKEIGDIRKLNYSNILGYVKTLREKTKKPDKHPHIETNRFERLTDIVDSFGTSIKSFETDFNDFTTGFEEEIESRIDQLNSQSIEDDVIKYVNSTFRIGENYRFERIIEICKSGKKRYELQIPPGYLDAEKVGVQRFGDYILWTQLLEHASSNGRPVIFVINDMKEDWWQHEGSKNIGIPRFELIQEFIDTTGQEIRIINSSKFYTEAKKFMNLDIQQDILDRIIKNSYTSYYDRNYAIEYAFNEWLQSSTFINEISSGNTVDEFEVDIIGKGVYSEDAFIEIKYIGQFDRNKIDNYFMRFVRKLEDLTSFATEANSYFLSYIFEDYNSGIEASKYVDRYVTEQDDEVFESTKLKSTIHLIVGYYLSGEYRFLYSDYPILIR